MVKRRNTGVNSSGNNEQQQRTTIDCPEVLADLPRLLRLVYRRRRTKPPPALTESLLDSVTELLLNRLDDKTAKQLARQLLTARTLKAKREFLLTNLTRIQARLRPILAGYNR